MPNIHDSVSPQRGVRPPPVLASRATGRSLRRRIVALGVILILAIDAAAVYDIWRTRQRVLEDADREIGNLTSALAEHTARTFQQIDMILRDTAVWVRGADPRVTSGEAVHEHLKQQIAGVPQIRALSIDGENGQPLHSSRALAPLLLASSERPFFTAQRDKPDGVFYINEPMLNRVDGKWGIAISRRLNGAEGQFLGIVVSITDVEYFERFYEALKLGKRSSVAMFRNDGTLLARHPTGEEMLGRTFDFVPRILGDPVQHDGHALQMKSPLDGSDKILALRAVPGFPLAISVARDEHAVLSSWFDHAVTMGVITLSLSLMVALLIALLVRKLAQLETADESLRVSEERYALAMEGSNEGHWDWDIVTDRLFMSPKMKELHGASSDMSVATRTGWLAHIDIHPEDKPRLEATMRDHLEGRVPYYEFEYRVRHRNGEWHWLLSRGRCQRDSEGRAYRFAGSTADITARKHAEEEKQQLEMRLRQAHKMEAMGTLAGGIAHDFNNILGAILGYGEMAQGTAPEGSTLRRYLGNILAAGNRAKALVARILAFSRSSMGERVPVRLRETVGEALELMQAALPRTIALRLNLDAEDARVFGDVTQLHQLVMNLCTNAAHAMPNGGTLTVGLDAVELDADRLLSHGSTRAGSYVRLTVGDTGHGMDEATLDRIFDPFFTTKDVGSGTGLGLSVVHGIVSELGGGINVESRVGAGSKFEVYLPRAAAAAVAEAEISEHLPRGNGETLLLVDDEEALIMFNEELLAGLGYEPVGFTSSVQALSEFRADPARFDLVLSDETMPIMTGTEFARALRAVRSDIPIILMSGYATPALVRKARAAGIVEVLGKPLQARELAAAIAHALRAKAHSAAE